MRRKVIYTKSDPKTINVWAGDVQAINAIRSASARSEYTRRAVFHFGMIPDNRHPNGPMCHSVAQIVSSLSFCRGARTQMAAAKSLIFMHTFAYTLEYL